MLNYNKLKYFLVVAEHLSITKAAKALFIGQPALSAHIKDLEQMFGVDLFLREKQRLILTPAGQKLYDLLSPCFPNEENLLQQVRAAAIEAQPCITVGVLGTCILDQMPDLVSAFKLKYPNVQVKLLRLPEKQLTQGLIDGSIDVSFQFIHEAYSDTFMYHPIMHGSMVVAMHRSNRLVHKAELLFTDLSGQRIAILDPEQDSLYSTFEETCLRYGGFRPNIAAKYTYMEPLLSFVAMGEAVAVISTLALPTASDNVCFRPLKGFDDNTLFLLWKKPATETPVIKAFIDHIKSYTF